MQAIQVKVLAPTNTKDTRIKAWCSGGSVTIARDHSQETNTNMASAAWKLAKKLGWTGQYRGGTLPNGDMCFVLGDSEYFAVTEDRGWE